MKNLKNNSTISFSLNQEISNIAERLSLASASEELVMAERTPRGMSAAGIIKVFNKKEYDAQTKKNPAKPTTSYVFYGGTYNPGKMGSVAIYDRNPMAIYSMMMNRKSLFGHRIVAVSMEKGLSTYVDVKFAA